MRFLLFTLGQGEPWPKQTVAQRLPSPAGAQEREGRRWGP